MDREVNSEAASQRARRSLLNKGYRQARKEKDYGKALQFADEEEKMGMPRGTTGSAENVGSLAMGRVASRESLANQMRGQLPALAGQTREGNIANAKRSGTFDATRSSYNERAKASGKQMDEQGNISNIPAAASTPPAGAATPPAGATPPAAASTPPAGAAGTPPLTTPAVEITGRPPTGAPPVDRREISRQGVAPSAPAGVKGQSPAPAPASPAAASPAAAVPTPMGATVDEAKSREPYRGPLAPRGTLEQTKRDFPVETFRASMGGDAINRELNESIRQGRLALLNQEAEGMGKELGVLGKQVASDTATLEQGGIKGALSNTWLGASSDRRKDVMRPVSQTTDLLGKALKNTGDRLNVLSAPDTFTKPKPSLSGRRLLTSGVKKAR